MHTPTALSLEDIKSERLPVLEPGPHTPSLGTTLTGSHPVWLDLDDTGGSSAFAVAGDIGCGKTLALTGLPEEGLPEEEPGTEAEARAQARLEPASDE